MKKEIPTSYNISIGSNSRHENDIGNPYLTEITRKLFHGPGMSEKTTRDTILKSLESFLDELGIVGRVMETDVTTISFIISCNRDSDSAED